MITGRILSPFSSELRNLEIEIMQEVSRLQSQNEPEPAPDGKNGSSRKSLFGYVHVHLQILGILVSSGNFWKKQCNNQKEAHSTALNHIELSSTYYIYIPLKRMYAVPLNPRVYETNDVQKANKGLSSHLPRIAMETGNQDSLTKSFPK